MAASIPIFFIIPGFNKAIACNANAVLAMARIRPLQKQRTEVSTFSKAHSVFTIIKLFTTSLCCPADAGGISDTSTFKLYAIPSVSCCHAALDPVSDCNYFSTINSFSDVSFPTFSLERKGGAKSSRLP